MRRPPIADLTDDFIILDNRYGQIMNKT